MTEEPAPDLDDLRDAWHRFGELDPLYAILTPDDKRLGGWDAAEFFATGATEINEALAYVKSIGVAVTLGRALDFGCGVGRLTQALGRHFEACVGLDIAPSMIEGARRFNGLVDRVTYLCSDAPALPFPESTFDFVYSRLVLQHIPPRLALAYVKELVRVTKPSGVVLLQTAVGLAPVGSAPHLDPLGCAATITVANWPRVVRGGDTFTLPCVVENRGSESWRSVGFHQIRLGNHWLTTHGQCLERDDGRAMFPHDLGPGEMATLDLTVTAPMRPGDYLLEVDIVEEAIAWFADRGSATTRIPIRVRRRPLLARRRAVSVPGPGPIPAIDADSPASTYDIPPVHVYWVDEDELRLAIASTGGRVVAERDDPAVSGYVSKQYCVVRA